MIVMRYRAWIAMGVMLAMLAAAPWSEAGYSSGKSSMSRSSSSSRSTSGSSRSSSSSSIGKGSSFSSGKGGSYSARSSSSTSSFGSAAAVAKRTEESHSYSSSSSSTPPVTPMRTSAIPTPDFAVRSAAVTGSSWRMRSAQSALADLAFRRYVRSSLGVQPMNVGYSPWLWLWLMDRPTLAQSRWAYEHRYVTANPNYDALVTTDPGVQQYLANVEGQDTASAAVSTGPLVTPSVVPLPVALEMTEAEEQAARTRAASVQIASQTAGWSPSPAYGGYHIGGSSSGLLPAAAFVLFVGVVVIGVITVARKAALSPVGGGDDYIVPLRASPAEPKQVVMDDPLGLTVGQKVAIRLPEYSETRFVVEELEQYSTHVNGRPFNYSAYWVAGEVDGEHERLQLRVERLEQGGLAMLVLHVHDELDYSEELYTIVERDRTGMFQITDDVTGAVTAEYYRSAGVLSAYKALVTRQRVGEPTSTRQVQYWDYSRKTDVPRGTIVEFLIVEMEQTSGRFRILVGPQAEAGVVGQA